MNRRWFLKFFGITGVAAGTTTVTQAKSYGMFSSKKKVFSVYSINGIRYILATNKNQAIKEYKEHLFSIKSYENKEIQCSEVEPNTIVSVEIGRHYDREDGGIHIGSEKKEMTIFDMLTEHGSCNVTSIDYGSPEETKYLFVICKSFKRFGLPSRKNSEILQNMLTSRQEQVFRKSFQPRYNSDTKEDLEFIEGKKNNIDIKILN